MVRDRLEARVARAPDLDDQVLPVAGPLRVRLPHLAAGILVRDLDDVLELGADIDDPVDVRVRRTERGERQVERDLVALRGTLGVERVPENLGVRREVRLRSAADRHRADVPAAAGLAAAGLPRDRVAVG